jgi:hypothetical protein
MTSEPTETSEPSGLALIYGVTGLIPFVGLAAVVLLSHEWRAVAAQALAGYGAVIVSFLGGLHWGLAMRSRAVPASELTSGIALSLLAWGALLLPVGYGLLALGLVLIACWAVDRKLYPRYGLQAWVPMRTQLTMVAALSCMGVGVTLLGL